MKKLIFTLAIMLLAGANIMAADYFWVGGSGNWNDYANHWATSSNGSTFHTQAPTQNDNVVFDANSFNDVNQIVTINVDAYCADMNWSGATNNPALAGATARKLYIYGSLTFIEEMNFSYLGEVYFESIATDRTITSAGQTFQRNVYFRGVGGYILQDSFEQINNFSVFLNFGTLDLNDQVFKVNIFNTYNTNVRALYLRSSEFIITSSSTSAFYFRGENLTFDAGTSTIRFITANARLNHGGNNGPGLAFHNVFFEAETGSSAVSNSPGSFNLLIFNSNGSVSGGNVIDTLVFAGNGTISTNGNNVNDITFNADATVSNNGTYGKVTMNGKGDITGSNTFGTLILSPGRSYTFTNGQNQIFDELTAVGSCTEPIIIQSSSTTAQTSFSKTGGSVSINYCVLQGINATGSASYTANNTVDLGNNTGWTINQPASLNLYWIGGTGDWNDPDHWSFSSGGAGGACIPNALDNVFFDANSFSGAGQFVNIVGNDDNNVFCNNMDWTGATNNPTLAGASAQNLRIHGSLTLNSNMNFTFAGLVYFNATETGHTIFTAGVALDKHNLYFDGEGGGWTLLDGLNIGSETLYLIRGSLNTNSKPVNVGIFSSNYTSVRELILGATELVITSSSNSAFYFRGENFTFNAGTSLIRFPAATAGLNHYSNAGPGLNFHDVIFEAATGTSNVSNSPGSFNTLTFNSAGSISGGNTINTLTFTGNGTISSNGNNMNTVAFNSGATINGNGTYGGVTIAGNGSITGNNTFGTLTLSPGQQYTFNSGRTQIFEDNLVANGLENEQIIIQSSTANSQTTFSKAEGTVTVNYVSLKDNNATGGATFIANNSIDLGNNTGWTINAPGGKDYYWVGGTGNWDDAAMWSLSSGGAGGAGVPTALDDVFFDANSFTAPGQTVTVIGDISNNARVYNMVWTGATNNPTLAGASTQNLRIHGSLTLNSNMNFTFAGKIYFNATETGQTILTAGLLLDNNDVYYDGEGGGWTLLDGLNVGSETLYLIRGSLNTNSKPVNMGIFSSNYTSVRELILGATELVITSSSNSAFYFRGENFTFNAGTSLIRFLAATAGLNHYSNLGPGLNFHDVIFEAATGTSNVSNSPGSFNTLTFNSAGSISGGNAINTLTFTGNGTISSNGNNMNTVVFNSGATINGNGTYGGVTITGNGSITGNNTFGTLTLSPGQQYTFTSGRTQIFEDNLVANGLENEQIIIQSSTANSQTTFSKTEGTVTVNYVSLKDNNATGGATFIANNSIDLGNNTGWTINAPGGNDYYWVGGTGNWDNAAMWSLSSGGTGGAGVPTVLDNVFFDANSFTAPGQTVTVIGDASNNARVYNMDWTGATNNPTLAGASTQNLRIHGSLALNPNMNFTFDGLVYFNATETGHTIFTAGVLLDKHNLIFDGEGGGWTLLDGLNIGSETLYLIRGSLNTNSKPVNVGLFNSNYTSVRELILGATEMVITSSSNSAFYFRGENFTFNAGTSLIRFPAATAGLNHYSNAGPGLNFNDVIFEAATGTSGVSNSPGSFNTLTFNSNGSLSGANNISVLTFQGSGTLSSNGNEIETAVFNGNGTITGNNTFGTIQFAPGFTYTFTSGRTQTILDNINATGTCTTFITIQSSSTTVNTIFYKESGEITVTYCNLQGINATGGADFIAENCIDLGNNSGWTFTQIPQNLYWIGGTGNWDDLSHWSAESGGAGGYCLPTQIDNVIFDQNSFIQTGQAVFINVANAECRDMDWSDVTFAPTFTTTSSSNNLRIHGSLTLSPNMNFAFTGATYFEGKSPAKTSYDILMAGKSFNNAVYFSGVGGVWTLQDALSISNNDLFLNHGTLNTNDQMVSVRRFYSVNNNIRGLSLGASVFNINHTITQSWYVSGSNLTLDAGTSEIRLTGTSGGLQSTTTNVLNYNNVIFQNPGGTSTLNSDDAFNIVQFNPSGKIQGGITINELVFNLFGDISNNNTFGSVKCFSGATIKGTNSFSRLLLNAGNSFVFESGRTQTISGRFIIWGSAASGISIASSTPGSAATISKPSGTVLGNYVSVKDMTASGGATFNLYSSIDNGNNVGWNFLDPTFETLQDMIITPGPAICYEATEIITIGGSGTHFIVQNGASISAIAGYKVEILPGTRVFSGGHFHAMITPYGFFCDTISTMLASDFVEVIAEEPFPAIIKEGNFFTIYPNPTTGLFTLELNEADEFSAIVIEISSMVGERIIRQELPAAAQFQINLSDYQPGIYMVRVIQGKEAGVLKIIKQ